MMPESPTRSPLAYARERIKASPVANACVTAWSQVRQRVRMGATLAIAVAAGSATAILPREVDAQGASRPAAARVTESPSVDSTELVGLLADSVRSVWARGARSNVATGRRASGKRPVYLQHDLTTNVLTWLDIDGAVTSPPANGDQARDAMARGLYRTVGSRASRYAADSPVQRLGLMLEETRLTMAPNLAVQRENSRAVHGGATFAKSDLEFFMSRISTDEARLYQRVAEVAMQRGIGLDANDVTVIDLGAPRVFDPIAVEGAKKDSERDAKQRKDGVRSTIEANVESMKRQQQQEIWWELDNLRRRAVDKVMRPIRR